MKHPFEHLSSQHLRAATLYLLAAMAVLTIVMVLVIPIGHLAQIFGLATAGNAQRASEVLASWPAAALQSAAFLVGFDFLYDLVHNNAAALLCVWGASFRGLRAQFLARWVAWVMWLCTLLNIPENLILLHAFRSTPVDPWFSIAVLIAEFRSLALWLAFPCGVLLLGPKLLCARRRSA